jgi:hypothetical protein
MLDTGVLIRALEYDNPKRSNDERVADCRAVWTQALRENTILIAANSVLEVLWGDSTFEQFPIVEAVEHVGFTYQVAERMASWARPAVLNRCGP